MFTTGQHCYLYVSCGLYGLALILSLLRCHRPTLVPLLAGFVIHGLYLAGRGWLSGVFYANPIFEGPFFLPWCVVAASLVWSAVRKQPPPSILLGTALVFCAMAVAYSKGVIPPTPKKMSALAVVFFLTENLGHALFYCGAILAIKGTLSKNGEQRYHGFLVWGFVLFSVSQVAGAAWCYVGWGNTFRWSPRHFTSAAIWLLYAAYLHLRFTQGWSARRKMIFATCAALLTFAASYGHYLREMTFPRVGG